MNKVDILTSNLILFYASFFSPFVLGALSFLFFSFIAMNNLSFRVKYLDIFIGCSLILFSLSKISAPLIQSLQCFRFFFGFYVIYLILRQSNITNRVSLNALLLIFSFVTFAEFAGVNFLGMDPNSFATNVFRENHKTMLFGLQRPVGLTGSPSTTAAVMISLLTCDLKLRHVKKITFILSLMALAISYSGVGLIIFLIYLIFLALDVLARRKSNLSRLFYIVGLSTFLLAIGAVFFSGYMTKMSFWYFAFVIDYKKLQILEYIRSLDDSPVSLILGLPLNSRGDLYGGDFAWLDFISCFGISGLFLYSLIFAGSLNKINRLPLAILLIGNFHYGTITNVVGQIVTAYFMAMRQRESPPSRAIYLHTDKPSSISYKFQPSSREQYVEPKNC